MTLPPPTLPPKSAPGWMRLVLALSLTANLVVLALVAGMSLNAGGHGIRGDRMEEGGFGAYVMALDRADRRALFQEMRKNSSHRTGARQAHVQAVAAALQAEPFDPEALKAAFATQETGMQAQISAAHQILINHLVSLDSTKRLAFAERLMRAGSGQKPAP